MFTQHCLSHSSSCENARNTSRFVLRSQSVLDSTYDSFVSAASGVMSTPGIIPAWARICKNINRLTYISRGAIKIAMVNGLNYITVPVQVKTK